jgi:hypothetical protein
MITHGQQPPSTIYNPYPPGILPTNLNSELAGWNAKWISSKPKRFDSCAPQKPRTTSGDTLFQLVFMMQTAQDVLNCDPTIARQSMSRVQLRKV